MTLAGPAPPPPGPMPADDGRLEVIALDGIPEIVAGDDLAGHLGDAIERTRGG